ncbi:MAG: hypothetical protein ACOC2W_01170 [bacterium]
MDKDVNKALNNFIGDNNEDADKQKKADKSKKEALKSRSGLIERVDKIYVTEDGRQLLREHY